LQVEETTLVRKTKGQAFQENEETEVSTHSPTKEGLQNTKNKESPQPEEFE